MMTRFAAAILAACFAVPAWAGPFLESSGKAPPIRASAELCEREPAMCRLDLSEAKVVRASQDLDRTIRDVNTWANRWVVPITDREQFGVEDRWDLPTNGYGDCEDIALLKREKLVELGIPRRAMPITVVIDETGGGHAVLMVRTDRGDFILDNRRDKVLRWDRTGYTFIKREGQDSSSWVWLAEGAPSS